MGAGGGAADGSEARGKPSAARRLSARLAARDPAKTKAYLDLYAPVPDGGPGVPSCPNIMCPIFALDPLNRLEFYLDDMEGRGQERLATRFVKTVPVMGPVPAAAGRACIPLACGAGDGDTFWTPYPFEQNPEIKACIFMGTGEVAVQLPTGETWVVDMAKALWVDGYGHYFGTTNYHEWCAQLPWRALPWREDGISVRIMVNLTGAEYKSPYKNEYAAKVTVMFVFEDSVPQHIRDGDFETCVRTHASVTLLPWDESPRELNSEEFHDFLYEYHMAPRRPFMIAVLLSLLPRVDHASHASLIGSLEPAIIRHILELAMMPPHHRTCEDASSHLLELAMMPESGSDPAIQVGGVIPLSVADSSLIYLMAGPQVGARPVHLLLRHRFL